VGPVKASKSKKKGRTNGSGSKLVINSSIEKFSSLTEKKNTSKERKEGPSQPPKGGGTALFPGQRWRRESTTKSPRRGGKENKGEGKLAQGQYPFWWVGTKKR